MVHSLFTERTTRENYAAVGKIHRVTGQFCKVAHERAPYISNPLSDCTPNDSNFISMVSHSRLRTTTSSSRTCEAHILLFVDTVLLK